MIAEFTPAQSCVPDDYSSINKVNTCECGVETCPRLTLGPTGDVTLTFVPSPCTRGYLSPTFFGKPSATVKFNLPAEETKGIQTLDITKLSPRPDDCLGEGMLPAPGPDGGFNTELPRAWCGTAYALLASDPAIAGLKDADVPYDQLDEVTNITGLESRGLFLNSQLGCPAFDQDTMFAAFVTNALLGPFCAGGSNATLCNNYIALKPVIDTLDDVSAPGATSNTAGEITKAAFDNSTDACPLSGPAEINVCLAGPIAGDSVVGAGLFPLIYLSGLGVLSYLFFIIAEVFFVKHDKKYWKSVEEETITQASPAEVAAGPLDD